MGCICSKETQPNQYIENNPGEKEDASSKKWSDSSKDNDIKVDVDATARLISDQQSGSLSNDERSRKDLSQLQRLPTIDATTWGGQRQPRITRVMSGERGAQVVAGWPSWLVAVAGEAINGWIPSKADSYEKLEKIGQGTYSTVYKARDIESNKIVALKKVRFANLDPERIRFMAREIIILHRLDHPNVMKLEGLIVSRVSGCLYLIFDYMEHDLRGLVATLEIKLTEAQIKCYMQQLLNGLDHCHSRGVLHRDIKCANLLIDYNGNLKIGDFGLATILRPNQMQPLTSRVVTLWYRPPELLLGSTDYGVTIDLWSSGCILAELFAGKPIMPGRTEVEQLHRIFKLCGSPSEEYWKRSKLPNATVFKPQHPYQRCVNQTFKDFPTSTLALLDMLLAVEPECRGTASSALESEVRMIFFIEMVKALVLQRASREKVNGNDRARKAIAIPAPDSNFELQASIQVFEKNSQSNTKSVNGVNNPGIPVEPLQGTSKPVCSHVSPSMHLGNVGSSQNMKANKVKSMKACTRAFGSPSQAKYVRHGATTLSQFSKSVSIRGKSRLYMTNPQWHEEHFNGGYDHDDIVQSTHHLFDRLSTSHLPSEESTTGYVPKEKRIHYSGPLMQSGHGRNLEEMLKEHERRMQNAVRKAHLDKTKTLARNSFDNNRQTESLLCVAVNGR
ncbi:hypothetical protein ES319_D04G206300v1 [Gossypium barbadense]|uniref:Protein kinase domain-containing protein n=1 Tax=Gossypium barbadense TaxID=3634 RepID=A0A5J5RXY4_GOSBA|nr:hypothetical protein ES319_D04G206300v1 [Gossypium barbadense]